MIKSPAIGIDFGTSYSRVAVFQNNKIEIIANDKGIRALPSYVAFSATEHLTGDAAKYAALEDPDNVAYDVKSLIGRSFQDPVVQESLRYWPFILVNEDGKPKYQVSLKGETKSFTPEDISTMIVWELKRTVEVRLKQRVTEAVVTVPSCFNSSQREAMENACSNTGLNILKVINEPAAAGMAYGLETKDKGIGEENIMVFDLGGGVLDVCVMCVEKGIFEVKSYASDPKLGGEYFDNRMVAYIIDDLRKASKENIVLDKRAFARLKAACEKAKRVLSTSEQATIEIASFFNQKDLATSITRHQFEELNADLFGRILEPVERALADAKLDKSKIQEIVLVGGSTRIPKVQKLLQDYFNGKELNKSINPDEAVAYGAAVQAAILSGDKSEAVQDLLLLDVAPLSLGIETAGGIMTPIIVRNTTIPAKHAQNFTTHVDGQTSIYIQVYEGEARMTKENHLLQQIELINIPPAPKGVPEIEVTFDLDSHFNLTVKADVKPVEVTEAELEEEAPVRERLAVEARPGADFSRDESSSDIF